MRLYHYVHCPFCIRVRMALSYLKLDYQSIILPYNDEKTPLDLTGVKMLPIMEINGSNINESLEIISQLDTNNKLKTKECLSDYPEIEQNLHKLGSDIHSLAMPYFIWTPEFDNNSRAYFQSKKEKKRGPFKDLVKRREQFESTLNKTLESLNHIFEKKVDHNNINLTDILYASHMWAMYIVPEFQFPEHIHNYLQSVKKACEFDYHGIYWS